MNDYQTYKYEVVTIDLSSFNSQNLSTLTLNKVEKEGIYFEVQLTDNVNLEMISIPAGDFVMGTPETEQGRSKDETPQHKVSMEAFWVGKYPVTQAQYFALMKENPSFFKDDRKPVENISWYEAEQFCQKLSDLTGKKFRLLSEAEWEYVCRAGTTTPFAFGKTITADLANYKANYGYGDGQGGKWRQETTPVGSFYANNFGLYDLHGNVWEWCQDNWHENYQEAPTDNQPWLDDNHEDEDSPRVIRGGSWDDTAYYCRSGVRLWTLPQFKGKLIGFRVACDY